MKAVDFFNDMPKLTDFDYIETVCLSSKDFLCFLDNYYFEKNNSSYRMWTELGNTQKTIEGMTYLMPNFSSNCSAKYIVTIGTIANTKIILCVIKIILSSSYKTSSDIPYYVVSYIDTNYYYRNKRLAKLTIKSINSFPEFSQYPILLTSLSKKGELCHMDKLFKCNISNNIVRTMEEANEEYLKKGLSIA